MNVEPSELDDVESGDAFDANAASDPASDPASDRAAEVTDPNIGVEGIDTDDGAARQIAAGLREHLDALGSLDEVGLGEHVDFYQRVHGELRNALSGIDDA